MSAQYQVTELEVIEIAIETPEVIALAKAHLHEAQMMSSAALCLHDAETLWLAGDHRFARSRLRSRSSIRSGFFILTTRGLFRENRSRC